jgi:hypothetical protein
MILGTSQIDITPAPGVELSGFAARIQPSIGVLDPLYAKALFLTHGTEKLLWIHCDLIGFDRTIVAEFRRWGREKLGLDDGQIMLSATHTHAGACTIRLHEAGEYDHDYVRFLLARLQSAAEVAIGNSEEVSLVTAEGRLALAVDRRKTASPHTDSRIGAVGFCRRDKSFVAVIVNYAMHPVALGSSNRRISADVPGQVALALARQLPGQPIVVVTNGACANLNPPAENVAFTQVQAWGNQIAHVIGPQLNRAVPTRSTGLGIGVVKVRIPADSLDAKGINDFAEKAMQNAKSLSEWGDKYRRVVEHWRSTLLARDKTGVNGDHHDAELFAVCLGDVILLGANAEVFSKFIDLLRGCSEKKVYLIGYANGDMGYLPTRAAYAEGGYEVEVAHLFYGGFRPRAGGLELLAHQATDLLRRF